MTAVLMTADTVGGVFRYAVDLSLSLARHGVHVTLATMGGPLSPAQRQEAASLDVLESAHRLEWMDDPWEDVARAGDWLLAIERRLRPDVVHVNGLSHAALPFQAPRLAVVHSCVISWWRAVRGGEAPPRYDRYRREARAGLSAADVVVAPTRDMLDQARRLHGPFARGLVIANAADPAVHAPALKEPFVFTAARLWDDAKNVAALGQVAPRLPWPVVAAGSDARPHGERRPIPSVRPLGVLGRDALAAWMARASIFALPARYEPFGLSALEAGLSGCALVLGDIASLREVWADAALFVPPEDTDALDRALRALIDDAALRARLALAARARALAFTPERTARAYLDLYERLRGEGRRIQPADEGSCA